MKTKIKLDVEINVTLLNQEELDVTTIGLSIINNDMLTSFLDEIRGYKFSEKINSKSSEYKISIMTANISHKEIII